MSSTEQEMEAPTFSHEPSQSIKSRDNDSHEEQVDYEETEEAADHDEVKRDDGENEKKTQETVDKGPSEFKGNRPWRDYPVVNGIYPNILFFSRFHESTTKNDIRELCEKYGPTTDISIKENIAFVDFKDEKDARRAKEELHRQPHLGSSSVICDYKKQKNPPRDNRNDLDARGYDRRRDDNDRFARDRPQRDHRDDYRAPDRDYTSRDRYATQAPDSRRDYSRSGPPSDRSGDLRDEIRRPAPRQAPPARRSLSPERRDLPRRPVEDRYLDAAPPRYQDDDFRGRPREDDLYRDRAPRRYDDPPRHDDRGRDSRLYHDDDRGRGYDAPPSHGPPSRYDREPIPSGPSGGVGGGGSSAGARSGGFADSRGSGPAPATYDDRRSADMRQELGLRTERGSSRPTGAAYDYYEGQNVGRAAYVDRGDGGRGFSRGGPPPSSHSSGAQGRSSYPPRGGYPDDDHSSAKRARY